MKLVMFDMDGTLTDSFALDENCYVLAIEQALGLSKVSTEWETYTHASSSYCLDAIVRGARGTSPSADEALAVQRRLVAAMEELAGRRGRCTREIPGAKACLAELSRRGYAVAIATGDWKLTAHHKLTTAGIPFAHLPAAFCDDSHVRTEIMQTALARAAREHHCSTFERVVYVGDAIWDVKACRELQWPLIGIGEAAQARRLRSLGVGDVLSSYEPLESFFTALDRATAPGSNRVPPLAA